MNKPSATIRLIALAFALIAVSTSCSAPAYKQNKYKSAKRFQDCGCHYKPMDNQTMVCLNEEH